MKSIKSHRLTLQREALRQLGGSDLEKAGGRGVTYSCACVYSQTKCEWPFTAAWQECAKKSLPATRCICLATAGCGGDSIAC
jgi:hypothetical protein